MDEEHAWKLAGEPDSDCTLTPHFSGSSRNASSARFCGLQKLQRRSDELQKMCSASSEILKGSKSGWAPKSSVQACTRVAHPPHVSVILLRSSRCPRAERPKTEQQVQLQRRLHLAQRFRHVDELVAAIVARARVTLAVLVGHDAADGVHDARGHEVLAGDELQALRIDVDSGGFLGMSSAAASMSPAVQSCIHIWALPAGGA